MKKWIAWLLTLCMMLGLFCGCGSADSGSNQPTESEQTVPTIAAQDEERETEPTKATEVEEEEEEDEPVELDVVLYDENGIKLTITGLEDGYWAKELSYRLENNTDHKVSLLIGEIQLNGITIDASTTTMIYAGETEEETIKFYYDELEVAGIEKIATVSCQDAIITNSTNHTTIAVFPFSFEIPTAAGYEQVIDDSGEVVFEESGITVICRTVRNEEGEDRIIMMVKNNMSQCVQIEMIDWTDDLFLNFGAGIKLWPGSVCFFAPEVYIDGEEQLTLEGVDEIMFIVQALDPETEMPILESGELTVSIN